MIDYRKKNLGPLTPPLPSKMSKPVLWLRCEKKEFECRSALTPTTSKKLIEAGFDIFVERDDQRIFDDSEYEASVLIYLISFHT